MKLQFGLITLSSVLLALVGAHTTTTGSCPVRDSNLSKERFNQTAFGGLWFEYLYDKDFREEVSYECSSWNLLSMGNGSYDLLQNALNKTSNVTGFYRHRVNCGEQGSADSQRCELTTKQALTVVHKYTTDRPRNF